MTKKANHQANIVRVTEIKPHTNADTLEIIPIGEYQAVVRKGQFSVGDLAVYIQPDSVVPQTEPFRFIWQPYFDNVQNDPSLCKHIDPATGPLTVRDKDHDICLWCNLVDPFVVPEKKRRITVRKFRGEWSEGLLLPLSDFQSDDPNKKLFWYSGSSTNPAYTRDLQPGDDVSDALGIAHYDPDSGKDVDEGVAPVRKKKYPKTIRGWIGFILSKLRLRKQEKFLEESDTLGIPVYDVDALKNYPNVFQEGEEVIITEKIHGSSARYIYLDGIMYAGSRNKWTAPGSANIFRRVLKTQPWIEEWCRAHEGYVLYGEVTPTQKGYKYGSEDPQFFVFDIRTPSGRWLDISDMEDFWDLYQPLMGHSVPVLYQGPYSLEKIKGRVDGPSTVPGAKNIREGIVIKTAKERHVRGVGRAQLKVVSNSFLEKDSK